MLYEAVFLFILFGVCCFIFLKYNTKQNLSIYLIAYGLFRFFIEYLRGDERGSFIPGISPSQFWSIIMVLAGVALFVYIYYITKKKPSTEAIQSQENTPTPLKEEAEVNESDSTEI